MKNKILTFVILAVLAAAVIIIYRLEEGRSKLEGRVYSVGILSGIDFFENTAVGFKKEMTALGYAEGNNIEYDLQKTNFDPAREREILTKFVSEKKDLILSFPTEASLLAKEITKGTQTALVFANANIEGVDLVDSVARPGNNLTGVRFPGPDLAIKRFEIMREIAPRAKTFLVPYLKDYPTVKAQMEVLRPVAAKFGIKLFEAPVTNGSGLQEFLDREAETAKNVDAVLCIAEPLCIMPDAFMVMGKFADAKGVPLGGAIFSSGGYSSLFGVSTNSLEVGKQAARLSDKIFKGISAGSIPVVSAESFIQINYLLAQKQNIQISEGLLRQANEIIR